MQHFTNIGNYLLEKKYSIQTKKIQLHCKFLKCWSQKLTKIMINERHYDYETWIKIMIREYYKKILKYKKNWKSLPLVDKINYFKNSARKKCIHLCVNVAILRFANAKKSFAAEKNFSKGLSPKWTNVYWCHWS